MTAAVEEYARELDSQIRQLAHHLHIAWEALQTLVLEARAANIHETLGYRSWTSYIVDALNGQWRVEKDKRGEVIRFLAEQGMSQRAIAATTGVGKSTVQRELSGAPMDQVILICGLDGKCYPRPEPDDDRKWFHSGDVVELHNARSGGASWWSQQYRERAVARSRNSDWLPVISHPNPAVFTDSPPADLLRQANMIAALIEMLTGDLGRLLDAAAVDAELFGKVEEILRHDWALLHLTMGKHRSPG
jgi:Homeodomain-like domain